MSKFELIYLWVEKYKNIENEGFNFSPRFKCEYKNDTKELTVDENKKYVSIFPDNINVTAIVGENGSGKSSLLKNLNMYKVDDKLKITILMINGQLVLFHNLKDFIVTNIIEFNKTYNITELNNKDLPAIGINYKNILFPTLSESLPLFLGNSVIAYNHKIYDTLNSIEMLQNSNIKLPFKKPKILYLDVKFAEDLDVDIQKQINNRGIYNDFIKKEIFYEDSIEYKIKLLKFYYLAQFIHLQRSELGNAYSYIVEECNNQNPTSIDDLIRIFSKCIDQEINQDINFIIDVIANKFENYEYNRWKINIDLLDNNFILKVKSTLLTTTNVSLSIYDTFNFSFNDQLSDGQYQFLLKFGKLYNYCQQNTLLLIDEGDILLHPKWQKNFVNYLLEFLNVNFNSNKYHIIITSHSPFILSDLPKENIIFLKNGKQENVDIDTFGANIHTLLSHGFFMQDGLIGEFAKSKIRIIKIIYKYILHRHKQKSLYKKEHKKSRRFIKTQLKILWYIQSIIGERFLQTIMKNYLNEIEQIFDNKSYKNKMKLELLAKFSKEELLKYLDEMK